MRPSLLKAATKIALEHLGLKPAPAETGGYFIFVDSAGCKYAVHERCVTYSSRHTYGRRWRIRRLGLEQSDFFIGIEHDNTGNTLASVFILSSSKALSSARSTHSGALYLDWNLESQNVIFNGQEWIGDLHDLFYRLDVERLMIGKALPPYPQGTEMPPKLEDCVSRYKRDPRVAAYTLFHANGVCELCGEQGPFLDSSGRYFLEHHHVQWLRDGGADTWENSVALCPNCHRKAHFSNDVESVKRQLRGIVAKRHRPTPGV